MALPQGRLAPVLIVVCVLLFGWMVVMPYVGTNARQPEKVPETPRKRDQFAAGAPTAPAPVRPAPFDGRRALGYIRDLCAIGPRISGSEGMRKQQELVKTHFEKLGAKVEFQRFTAKQVSQTGPVDMANMVITWHPDRERRVLLCSHYDTRPRADQERNRNDWDKPFVSANDGTSGVAWLMELGHHVKQLPLTVGLDFVLFDGEEFVFDAGLGNPMDRYFFGSEHFADNYRRSPPKHAYAAGILLDLFAGKDPKYSVEGNSYAAAPGLVKQLWDTAAEFKVSAFAFEQGPTVNDDHLALNRVHIPTVDIIDLNYPHWHKLTDQPDQCSAASMEDVAKVLSVWLQRTR